MAEFQEVMRQRARMCNSYAKCKDCGLYSFPSCTKFTDDEIEMAERIIMEWVEEHTEPCYPTWAEWQYKEFPDSANEICIRHFTNAQCITSCGKCRNQPIPEYIAQKLGIKPITEERDDQ